MSILTTYYSSSQDDRYEERNKFCTEFIVAQNLDVLDENSQDADTGKSNHTIFDKDMMNSTFSAKFGHFNKKSYTSGLPYSGKVNLLNFEESKLHDCFRKSNIKLPNTIIC